MLFTFLAERYERRTVMITSNLVFSEWDRIFKDPMTTAAAIDRLVHHAVILEMTGSSIRIEQAQAGRTNEGGNEPNHTNTTATDNPIPGAAPTALGPAATTTTPTTSTPTTTTEGTSTSTPQSPTTITPPTDNPIPGAAPTAPGPATATNHRRSKGGSTNDRKEKIKKRVQQQRSERDGEM